MHAKDFVWERKFWKPLIFASKITLSVPCQYRSISFLSNKCIGVVRQRAVLVLTLAEIHIIIIIIIIIIKVVVAVVVVVMVVMVAVMLFWWWW
jgi:hypothetical protein